MITIILFLLSIGMQLAATIYALLLVRATGRKTGWILISVAMILMTWRGIASFTPLLTGGAQVRFDLPDVIALVISCLLLLGVLRLRNYSLSIHASVAERNLAEQRLAAQYAVARALAESARGLLEGRRRRQYRSAGRLLRHGHVSAGARHRDRYLQAAYKRSSDVWYYIFSIGGRGLVTG
jgi:hypothetical protein